MSFDPLPSEITHNQASVLALLNLPPERISTMRTTVYAGWVRLLGFIQPVAGWLMLAAFALFALSTVSAVRRWEFSFGLLMAGTLWLAVLTRAALLSLIHVSSFYAIDYSYAAPATVLAVAASVLSMFEAFSLRPRRNAPALEGAK